MRKSTAVGMAAVTGFVIVAGGAGAGWLDLLNGEQSLTSGQRLAVCYLDEMRALVAYEWRTGSEWRICAGVQQGTGWTPVDGGSPVDEGLDGMHARPVLAADGRGGAFMIYGRYAGTAWRLFARRYDGLSFSNMNGGAPVDGNTGGNSIGAGAALLADDHLLLAFARRTGTRMALHASEFKEGTWTVLNGGEVLDNPAGGYTEDPSVAADGSGGAVVVYTQEVSGYVRVYAKHFTGSAWVPLNGGAPVDIADGGESWQPKVEVLPNGHIVVVYLHYDPDEWIYRMHASLFDGEEWQVLNGGQPIDQAPSGVGTLAIAEDNEGKVLVAYATFDDAGIDAPRLFSLLIDGVFVNQLNGGDELQAPAAPDEIRAVGLAVGASGAAVLAFSQDESGADELYGRVGQFAAVPEDEEGEDEDAPADAGTADAGSTAAAAAGAPDEAAPPEPKPGFLAGTHAPLTVVGNVFNPALGGSVRIVCWFDEPVPARVTVFSVEGRRIAVIADGTVAAGQQSWHWDGHAAGGDVVPAGTYVVLAQAGEVRAMKKVVVVR